MHRRRNMAISESQIQSELQLCDEFKEAIDAEWEKAKHEFSEQKAAVIERRKALETLLKTQGATSKQGALFDMPPVSQIGVGKKQRGKTDTSMTQEILQSADHCMCPTSLNWGVSAASLSRGAGSRNR